MSGKPSSRNPNASELEREFFQQIDIAQTQLQGLPWDRSEMYWSWLSQTSHFVDWTTRLIGLASGSCSLTPASSEFHRFLVLHLREEFNHDLLAQQDLASLRSLYPFLPQLRQAEFKSTFLFHRSLRRKLMKDLPSGEFALLGRMLFLEGLAAHFGPKLSKTVSHAFGQECGRFISLHGEADQEHLHEDLGKLRSLDSVQLKIVYDELQSTAQGYSDIIGAWKEFAKNTSHTELKAG